MAVFPFVSLSSFFSGTARIFFFFFFFNGKLGCGIQLKKWQSQIFWEKNSCSGVFNQNEVFQVLWKISVNFVWFLAWSYSNLQPYDWGKRMFLEKSCWDFVTKSGKNRPKMRFLKFCIKLTLRTFLIFYIKL